jgi:outer membrane protein TolC
MRPGRLVLSVVVAWSSTPGSAGAQLRTAETAVTSARSRLFPQIGADLAYVRTLENPYSPGSRALLRLEAGRAGVLKGGGPP